MKKYFIKIFGIVGLFVLSANADVECVITPTGSSVGYSAGQEPYLFVFAGSQPYRLGLISDEKAKFRYSTVLSAISLGKNIRLYYYALTSTNNCVNIFQQDGNLSYIKME